MKRLNPFSGMHISLFDASFWTGETADAIKQRINSDLYNHGVVSGLTVFASATQSGTVAVTPGVAYNPEGDRIEAEVLQDRLTYSGTELNNAASTYRVVARYVQGNDGTSGLDSNGNSQFRHYLDSFSINVLKVGVDVLQDNDTLLSEVIVTAPGASLIMDANNRDVFSAKFAAAGNDISQADTTFSNVTINHSLVVGGCITSLMGASFGGAFVNDFGFRVTGVACFFRPLVGLSDIKIQTGDLYVIGAGKGVIIKSPDGTKQARLILNDSGIPGFEPLNY